MSTAQQGRGIIQLLDMEFVNKEAFLDEYVSQAEPYLRRFDASPAMVSTCKNRKFRGLWEPGHIVVNWWANPEQFWSAYQSGEASHYVIDSAACYCTTMYKS
jgi:hypothetical protein